MKDTPLIQTVSDMWQFCYTVAERAFSNVDAGIVRVLNANDTKTIIWILIRSGLNTVPWDNPEDVYCEDRRGHYQSPVNKYVDQ